MALNARGRPPSYIRRTYDWRLRGIRWLDIVKYQHWGGLLLFIPAVVITGIAHWTFQDRPVIRQALVYDATISYPPVANVAVPNSLAVVFNWIVFAIAVLVVELVIFYKQHSLTVALTGILHQLWSCAVNFVICIAIAEVTKPFSGRLRPDFLSRCHPADAVDPNSNYTTVLGDHAAVLGPLHVGQVAGPCTNPDTESVLDGRLSFPSGHASNSMSLAWYTALYLMWSLYLRADAPYPRRPYQAATLFMRVMQELFNALAYGLLLLALCLSWFIGATRFWDNQHHVADIVGGFVLSIIFSTPYVIKAIGLHQALRDQIDGQMDQKTTVLSPAGEDNGLPITAPTPGYAGAQHIDGSRPAGVGGQPGDAVLQMGPIVR